jgi:hypothetical protein
MLQLDRSIVSGPRVTPLLCGEDLIGITHIGAQGIVARPLRRRGLSRMIADLGVQEPTFTATISPLAPRPKVNGRVT